MIIMMAINNSKVEVIPCLQHNIMLVSLIMSKPKVIATDLTEFIRKYNINPHIGILPITY